VDRVKLLAWLSEESERCQMCGTSAYEWESDPYFYAPSVHVCQGCAMKENSRESARDVPGGTVVLLSGAAKKAELQRQAELYRASRKRDR
jgi:hypothetical protein